MTTYITACIDGSEITGSVCDLSVWVSSLLDVPIKLLHVIEKTRLPAKEDLSGSIGLGSREHLLDELTALDERRGKLAKEHGKLMLSDATGRIQKKGLTEVISEQRHGDLLETLLDYEADTRLFVIGRLGTDHSEKMSAIGSHVENVVRAIQTPVLIATGHMVKPESYMIAYDGSDTADLAIEKFCQSPLLKSMTGHLVMVNQENEENDHRLNRAKTLLQETGHQIESHLIQGHIISALESFQQENNISLKVMGAYGHSRLREFFVGSNTSKMIMRSKIPVLLLR